MGHASEEPRVPYGYVASDEYMPAFDADAETERTQVSTQHPRTAEEAIELYLRERALDPSMLPISDRH